MSFITFLKKIQPVRLLFRLGMAVILLYVISLITVQILQRYLPGAEILQFIKALTEKTLTLFISVTSMYILAIGLFSLDQKRNTGIFGRTGRSTALSDKTRRSQGRPGTQSFAPATTFTIERRAS